MALECVLGVQFELGIVGFFVKIFRGGINLKRFCKLGYVAAAYFR